MWRTTPHRQSAEGLLQHKRSVRIFKRSLVRARQAPVSTEEADRTAKHSAQPGQQDAPKQRIFRLRELRPDGREVVETLSPGARLKSLFLPEGYPLSVSSDYLDYQLWSVPTHITGWLSHTLTTSSLLQAVGLSAGPAGTTALAAAFKWIAKDGIGAAGRLLVGGKLGLELDDDPRRWRMLAELVTTLGLALEALTSMYPSQFLLLACSGNFAKALGKGIGKPAFRVVQNHFAVANNVGAVSAKEEVWEVVGQLAGYAASLALLQALEDSGSSQYVIAAWAATQGVHILLRRQALSCLVFATLNRKRACLLVMAHVRGQALPGVRELNRAEPLWEDPLSMQPHMELGCSLSQLLDSWQRYSPVVGMADGASGTEVGSIGASNGRPADEGVQSLWKGSGSEEASVSGRVDPGRRCSGHDVQSLAEMYAHEQYILCWSEGRAYVMLKQDAGPSIVLRALWQAAWLHHHTSAGSTVPAASSTMSSNRTIISPSAATTSATPSQQPPGRTVSSLGTLGSSLPDQGLPAGLPAGRMVSSLGTQGSSSLPDQEGLPAGLQLHLHSLAALQQGYGAFEAEARALGWNLDVVNIKGGNVRVSLEA